MWAGEVQELVVARGIDGEVGILGGPRAAARPARDRPAAGCSEDAGEVGAVVDGGFLACVAAQRA